MLRQSLFRTARSATAAAAAPRVTLNATRSYAAAAAPAKDGQPPVSVFGLDGTYASALYTAAAKTSSLEPTAKALTALGALVGRDAKLGDILSAPSLSHADKTAVIAELQKQAGPTGNSDTVRNFLAALAENNRLGLLRGVCDKFATIMSAARGEVEMTVTSATPLDNRTLNKLESAVAKSSYISPGQKLKVTNPVNPDIVGGLVVEIGDRTIDLSVSARLAKMNKLLTDTL